MLYIDSTKQIIWNFGYKHLNFFFITLLIRLAPTKGKYESIVYIRDQMQIDRYVNLALVCEMLSQT